MRRPGVKICGVTRPEDALLATELGADLIGINFWHRSPRFVEVARAKQIVAAVQGRALTVGVWVDPTRARIEAVDRQVAIDLHQIHGELRPSAVDWFPGRVIQAIRLAAGDGPVKLERFDQAWGFLFDCAPPELHGGTGKPWSYERIADLESPKPVLLAGGLDPENVVGAMAASGADIADVCSGVEAAPGIKDPALLERFLSEVRNVQEED